MAVYRIVSLKKWRAIAAGLLAFALVAGVWTGLRETAAVPLLGEQHLAQPLHALPHRLAALLPPGTQLGGQLALQPVQPGLQRLYTGILRLAPPHGCQLAQHHDQQSGNDQP